MYSLVYLLSLSLVLLFALALHVYVIKPYLEGPALRHWYARQTVQWIGEGDLLNDNLVAYIRSRYVSYDTTTGAVGPLDCNRYTHVFLATSDGRPMVIEAEDAGTWSGRRLRVTDRMSLEHDQVKDLVLRPYMFRCSSSMHAWREHFRDDQPAVSATPPVSALRRYTYTVGFEPPAESLDVGRVGTTASPPKTVTEAVLSVTRVGDIEPVLTFRFSDTISGQQWTFQLSDYIKSAFADVESTANVSNPTGAVWERLPELWLTRHAKRRMDEDAAHDLVLFAADGEAQSMRAVSGTNPCWASSLNRFVVGDFPVTVEQYSGIYLRGLQRLTSADLDADPEARRAFERLYWTCVYDYDSRVNRRLTTSPDTAPEDKSAIRRPNLGINVDSILYNTLLSLNSCPPEQRFDAQTGKCVVTA